MKTFTQEEIYEIINELVRVNIENKDAYIQKNGYAHKDVLERFAIVGITLSSLYAYFK